MKELLRATPTFASVPRKTGTKVFVCATLIVLASCTNTQVRWDAVKMRQDVMLYYNDQIIENLIKAKNNLPFVHVDIQTLTSSGASSVTGSVGYGETTTNQSTHAQTVVAKMVGGLVATATHTALHPFSYSVAPTRSETLTITAGPTLGSAALLSPNALKESAPQVSPIPTPTLTPTEKTITTWPTLPEKQQVVENRR
jgi:hypothetical protein